MDKNIDLHCDLTAYLIEPGSSVNGDIRCSLEKLQAGNVKMQVMALYSSTEKGSVEYVRRQVQKYTELLQMDGVYAFNGLSPQLNENLGIIAAIENASGLCEETDEIQQAAKNIEYITSKINLMYVGLTHHLENRFGGGNFSEAGLKNDGKYILELLPNRKIAIDLSHTSDQLAYGILTFIDQNNLEVPVIASHSNMRSVFDHKRNLPDELVQEIVRRKGLIGLNFVKYFINPDDGSYIYRHIEHAVKLGAEDHLCYGADFFDDKSHPDQQRYPYFFDELGDPLAYAEINRKVVQNYSEKFKEKLSHGNVLDYFDRLHKQ